MTMPGKLDKSHGTSLCAAGAPDNTAGGSPQCKKTSRGGCGGVTAERGRPAAPRASTKRFPRAQDSQAAFIAVGFPFRQVETSELALLGTLADASNGSLGYFTIADGRAGTSRATALPCRVMVNSCPFSARSSNWPSFFLASKAPTERMGTSRNLEL